MSEYKTTIGLEIHAELKTRTKMFCESLNDPDEKQPNTNICPICVGHPGTLPVINYDAVKKVIMAGLALGCQISKETFFERKNYFYPDLPKGYQISQYQKPLCENGILEISNLKSQISKKIRIERIHLEEDAGRLYHTPEGTLVDYNRAGVPLMELVTKPDLKTGEDVVAFAEELQLILRYLGVSDADMEKGLMRVEVNVSISKTEQLGTKVEVKNLNSIKVAAAAVDYEIKRQSEALEAGDKILQETRGWDEKTWTTVSQRSKEQAHDYRYFPEPDLPPLSFDDEDIKSFESQLPELPNKRRERFAVEYGLPKADIEVFTRNKKLGDYFEQAVSEATASPNFATDRKHDLIRAMANYLINTKVSLEKISPEMFGEFGDIVISGTISSSAATTVLNEMATTGLHPDHIIREKDLAQVSGTDELSQAVESVIIENAKAAEDYKGGKNESLKFLIGRVMAATKGKANPEVVAEILKEKLKP